MRRKFLTNLILLLFLNLLIKPFWRFGIDMTVQNVVGDKEYGFYISLFNFAFLFNILLDLGITNFNNRNIAQNTQLLNKHFSNIIVLRFILAIFYFLVCFIIAYIIGYNHRQFYLLGFLAFNQFLLQFVLYLRSNITALQLFKTNSFISVLDRTLMIILGALLLWGGITKTRFQIEWLVYLQTIAYIFTAIVAFFVVLSKSRAIKLKFNWQFLVIILKKSFPFALLILLMSLYSRIDFVLLERLLPEIGKEQAGIYAQSFRILDVLYQYALLFSVLLLPIFSKMIKQKESIEELLKLSFLLLIIPAVIFVISTITYKEKIMDLLYKNYIVSSAQIYGILIISFISLSIIIIFGTLLTANGNLKELIIISGFAVILNLILNLFLIPQYYAFGAAVACLVTQSFAALLQVFLTMKKFQLKTNKNLIFSISLFIASVYLISISIKYLIHNWLLGFVLIILLSIFIAFFVKLFRIKALFNIIKQE